MSNINECPAIRFVFFRQDHWYPPKDYATIPKPSPSNTSGSSIVEYPLPGGSKSYHYQDYYDAWYRIPPASTEDELVCVGYTVDAEDVASIAVHKLGKLGRGMGKQIVAGKLLAGKTFEIVTVPHRLEQSIILGAKYFLLTRERA